MSFVWTVNFNVKNVLRNFKIKSRYRFIILFIQIIFNSLGNYMQEQFLFDFNDIEMCY